MDMVFLPLAAALVFVMLVVVVVATVLILRRIGRLTQPVTALDVRIAGLEATVASLRDVALHAREAKDAVARLGTDVGDLRGRLSGIADGQAKNQVAVASLQSLLPLQIGEGIGSVKDRLLTAHTEFRTETVDSLDKMRAEMGTTLRTAGEAQERQIDGLRSKIDEKLSEIVTRTAEGARALGETAQVTTTTVTDRLAELKSAVDTALKQELGAIREENSAKLEEMRKTVDEKLHATLEQRLGDSFKLVSDRLELVHRGLGEMQALAIGVGDLKKVLSNVKTRGGIGEVQLGSLLEQILTIEQYGRNVSPIPGSGAVVEFAIKLPGGADGRPVWLPIDAKFPVEDYQRLGDAQDRADVTAVEDAGKALETRLKLEAKKIRDKYVEPPFTTDFAVMFLPTEGLYAEALRRPGLADWVQRECKVVIAGPTNLWALLNSLQMGFRTLTIEKRSSEVWTLLGTVKSEFGKFGEALAHTKKKLAEATSSIEKTEQRNRVLVRKLDDVDSLPAPSVALSVSAEALLPQPVPGACEYLHHPDLPSAQDPDHASSD